MLACHLPFDCGRVLARLHRRCLGAVMIASGRRTEKPRVEPSNSVIQRCSFSTKMRESLCIVATSSYEIRKLGRNGFFPNQRKKLELWGLLWGPHRHFGTCGHNLVQLKTTGKLIAKKGVAGFLSSVQSVAKSTQRDFQDHPFQPLTHPSAWRRTICTQL